MIKVANSVLVTWNHLNLVQNVSSLVYTMLINYSIIIIINSYHSGY
jgi:hypothetical protein